MPQSKKRFTRFTLLFTLIALTATVWTAQASDQPPANAPALAVQMGAQVYAQRCSTCHGDVGQGLTDAWRATWDEEHQNCSTSKCHGRDHPPEGFYLPNNYAPAIVSPDALRRFANAQSLYVYVSHAMPYSAPGDLTPEQYWRVVDFLLWANGVIGAHNGVSPDRAAEIALDQRMAALPTITPAMPVPQPVGGMSDASDNASASSAADANSVSDRPRARCRSNVIP